MISASSDPALYAQYTGGAYDVAEAPRAAGAPPSDAASASKLDGSSWLGSLLKTVADGYVAVETVRTQRRNADGVTTQDVPRVGAATQTEAPAVNSKQLLMYGAGLLGAIVLLWVLLRRK